jgi:hypothetical protein
MENPGRPTSIPLADVPIEGHGQTIGLFVWYDTVPRA